MTALIIAMYLGAAVAANLAVARFGPWAMPAIGFVIIGFDLTARDVLHDRWGGGGLAAKMAALIAAGSVLTYAANPSAGRIAAASAIAFVASAAVDTVAYHLMRRWRRVSRMAGSNVVSAAVDSIVFPLAAFGILNPWVSLAQWSAKSTGGCVWAGALDVWRRGGRWPGR